MSRTAVGYRDRQIALLLFGAALGLYLRTLAPGLLYGDPGEFQMAASRWGIAHPTGYPLYLILGGFWQQVAGLAGLAPSTALNVFSVLTSAASVSALYLLLVQMIGDSGTSARLSAITGSGLLMVNPSFWSQSVIAEVYSLHVLLILMVLLVSFKVSTSFSEGATGGHTPDKGTVLLFCLLGLSLTHHRTSLFLLPGILLLLFWLEARGYHLWRQVLVLGAAIGIPQLLYAYIPLRSGPNASPWLYQRLDGETLSLYDRTLQGFIDFIAGRVFVPSFYSTQQAVDRLPQMAELWFMHFSWAGLALMLLGLLLLFRDRRWELLLVTVPFVSIHQIFNLFYGIDDIFVYYIALYLIGAIWAAFGLYGLLGMMDSLTSPAVRIVGQGVLFTAVFLFTVVPLLRFYPDVDQSDNQAARSQWDAILEAQPSQDAILITNDRNEMVPLYYLQAVEEVGQEMTGLFPLLTPDDRFADVVAVTETALTGDRPVYLIKSMDGLATRFELQPARDPLIQVTGEVSIPDSLIRLDLPYGPLTLLGYTYLDDEDELAIELYWRVEGQLDANYTTSLQAFDNQGERLAQSDRRTGDVYYPTTYWRPGQIVRGIHRLEPDGGDRIARFMAVMYVQTDRSDGGQPVLDYLAPALEWSAGSGRR